MKIEEMQSKMHDMMAQCLANMSADEKTEMMMAMMEKMKEGAGMEQMMAKMDKMGGPGAMQEMMGQMMSGGDEQESMMPEMMLKTMMPHCVTMMMPKIPKDKRADLIMGTVTTLMGQASSDMSDEEKVSFKKQVIEAINA